MNGPSTLRRFDSETFLRWTVVLLLSSAWVLVTWSIFSTEGLFRWIGIDYANYRSQAAAFMSGGDAALYDLGALGRQLAPLAAYTRFPEVQLVPGPVPFPAIYAWIFRVFALPAPPIGFGLWTGLNILAAFHLARRAAQLFPNYERRWVAAIVLTSFPIVYTIWVGEPTILLGCAVAEAYLSFRAGNEFRAGLWVACLLLKPQYGILIGPLLIWKRQWSAVAGALSGVALIIGASILVAGPQAILGYPSSLNQLSGFNGAGTIAYPEQMINWRGMILRVAPEVNDRTGTLLALALGGMTVLLAASAWRGPWLRQSWKFPGQMTVIMLATLLANYHSHVHGGPLLVVPLAALLAQPSLSKSVLAIAKALILVPTLVFISLRNVPLTAWPLSLGMLLLFGVLVCRLNSAAHELSDGPATESDRVSLGVQPITERALGI